MLFPWFHPSRQHEKTVPNCHFRGSASYIFGYLGFILVLLVNISNNDWFEATLY